ncbi:YafY family transcriptional regulator [Streptacidiphilus sp. PB12-B1b]|uniref:helix-turn-helix transcriptional regulator n=1 Tax=Streptacidiphilus sp. PB12-B1b TaxID=2705012 RepID=UPI0015F85F83|nr:YafY family protein [Streptacidiphilus sp. PB12-B1b]QMU76330.1 YafY family transcriptional regulator [Streptacidiphilus sp. PB12-B1b]
MKADRLLSIMLLLQTRGRVSAVELAERLEVSVRTVYRDVEALSAAGVPVWTEQGRNGGVRLLEGYRTDVTGLTSDEARALFVLTAEGTYDALGLGSAVASALRKVMAALPAPYRADAERTSERILVDPVRWRTAAPATVELAELQQAVFTDRRLELTYRHSGSTELHRYTVDPYGLVSKAGVWYLVADREGEPRLFRADRVHSAATSAEPVRRRPRQGLSEVWSALRDQVERRPSDQILVRCRVHRPQLDMFLRLQSANLLGPPAEPAPDPDWPELDLGFPALRAVRALLVFGADVRILTPPEARTELATAAAEITALYATP